MIRNSEWSCIGSWVFLGGKGNLGVEGKRAKIDREISICILCAITLSHVRTKCGCSEEKQKGKYETLSPTYLSNAKLEQRRSHHSVTLRNRCNSCILRSYLLQPPLRCVESWNPQMKDLLERPQIRLVVSSPFFVTRKRVPVLVYQVSV